MKISRTTIGKYLKNYEDVKSKLMGSGDLKLKEDIICSSKYNSAGRKKQKLTDEILQKIQLYLKENEEKIDILEALKDDGHDIGYTTVYNAVREIERKTKEAFIKQQYSWGDLSEFDRGEVKLIIGQRLKVLQMGAFTTCKGNYCYADLYFSQKMENLLCPGNYPY